MAPADFVGFRNVALGYAINVDVLAGERRIAETFEHPGPFVTVYLDATRSTESGAHEVEVRWRDVRSELARRDADDRSLAAIDEAIAADVGTPGPHGLVLVAADGQLCFAGRLPDPPSTSYGTVGALPHLMPYLAQRATDVPHVVAVADRTGADILAVRVGGDVTETSVSGGTAYPMHRTATADWSERHFQLRVENTWEANARDVAAAVARTVSEIAAPLVVIAGDVRARHLIADDLASGLSPEVIVRTIEEGGRAAGSSTEALEAAVRQQVLRYVWQERREVLEHLSQNLGRGAYAVAGAAEVADALRMAQADTVVLSDDPSSTLRAWIGPEPTEFGLENGESEAAGTGPVDHDRYDAALVRAIVGSGARLVVTPGAHEYLADGVGALLRYEHAAAP
jgi:hypothetical protein